MLTKHYFMSLHVKIEQIYKITRDNRDVQYFVDPNPPQHSAHMTHDKLSLNRSIILWVRGGKLGNVIK